MEAERTENRLSRSLPLWPLASLQSPTHLGVLLHVGGDDDARSPVAFVSRGIRGSVASSSLEKPTRGEKEREGERRRRDTASRATAREPRVYVLPIYVHVGGRASHVAANRRLCCRIREDLESPSRAYPIDERSKEREREDQRFLSVRPKTTSGCESETERKKAGPD